MRATLLKQEQGKRREKKTIWPVPLSHDLAGRALAWRWPPSSLWARQAECQAWGWRGARWVLGAAEGGLADDYLPQPVVGWRRSHSRCSSATGAAGARLGGPEWPSLGQQGRVCWSLSTTTKHDKIVQKRLRSAVTKTSSFSFFLFFWQHSWHCHQNKLFSSSFLFRQHSAVIEIRSLIFSFLGGTMSTAIKTSSFFSLFFFLGSTVLSPKHALFFSSWKLIVSLTLWIKYLGTLRDDKLSFSDNTALSIKNHSNICTSCENRDVLMLVVSCHKLCPKV